MAVVLIKGKVTPQDLMLASEDYGEYIKIVVDVVTGDAAIGGEWHADGEKILLEKGSRQKNIWGGGIDLKTRNIETVALINLRPRVGNNSQEILDKKIRKKFVSVVKKKFAI